MPDRLIDADLTDSSYKGLCRLGGAAALIAALLTLSEVILLALYPQPGAVSGWFRLFQDHPIIGLLDAWGLELPMYLMFIPVFLAFYLVLGRSDKGWMALATILALLGVGIFLATNNPFSMLSLSHQYAAATTNADRSALLAAGQAWLANTNQRAVGGFNTGLFLVSVAGLIVSPVMLRSSAFTKATAFVGILANSLSLVDYVREALTASAVVALLVILPNALLLVVWLTLAGRRLNQLGRSRRKALPKAS